MSAATCDRFRAALSALADREPAGEVTAAEVADHLDGCSSCRAFDDRITEVRSLLRFEPVGEIPDVAAAVHTAIASPAARRRARGRVPWLAAAAAAIVGAVAGSVFAGAGPGPAPVAAADLPELLQEAQRAIVTLEADVEITDADATTYTGTLAYRAPESLSVELADAAGAPLTTVVDDDLWWTEGSRRCTPPAARPCGPTHLQVVEDREPFAEATPVPLELVAPADALRVAPAGPLGERSVGGRPALGIAASAGQLAELLSGLDPLGSLRPLHPTDPAELWLDRDHLVPLDLTVRAADTPARRRWAAAHGYRDEAEAVVLRLTVTNLRINGSLPADAFPRPPSPATTTTDGGFEDRARHEAPAPAPAHLPAGMTPHRQGAVRSTGPAVQVQTWSDGRAWLAVRSTSEWPGGRLFGALGGGVRPIDLGDAGTGYLDGTATRLALHADGLDLIVTGTVGSGELRQVAASLGVRGLPVPDTWAEATAATLEQAARVVPGLLGPGRLAGFDPPAVRIDGETVTVAVTGPGDRAFQLVRTALEVLPPPLDPEAIGVRVRGTDGRYQPANGDLEWVEQGVVHSLRSGTLGPAELLTIAEGLEPVP